MRNETSGAMDAMMPIAEDFGVSVGLVAFVQYLPSVLVTLLAGSRLCHGGNFTG